MKKTKHPRLNISAKTRRLVGRAIYRYDLIAPGDNIAVGLSGGKDSLLLLHLLKFIKIYSPVKYNLHAIAIDMTNGDWDISPLKEICDEIEVPLHVVPYAIEHIIEVRNEQSPCSLCANFRRGLLNAAATKAGCNKLALGHNLDDVVETALINLLRNGRFRSFQPKLWHDKAEMWVIRPMIYLTEHRVECELARLGLTPHQHYCKYGAETERSRTKSLISQLEPRFPDIKPGILHALENHKDTDSWHPMPKIYKGLFSNPESPEE